MTQPEGSAIHLAQFAQPPNCYFLFVSVKTPGISFESETTSLAINKDGRPLKHTIPLMITRGGLGNDVANLFANDAEYYPQEFERWAALLLHRLKQQMSGADNQTEIEDLAKDLNGRYEQLCDVLDEAQRFDALATLAASSAFAGDWASCAAMLEELHLHIDGPRPLYVRARESTTMYLLTKLFEFTRFARGRRALQASEKDHVDSSLAQLFQLGGSLPGGAPAQGIIRTMHMQPDSLTDEFLNAQRRRMIVNIPSLLAEMSDCDLVVNDQLLALYLADCEHLDIAPDVNQIDRSIDIMERYFVHGADPQWCSPGILAEPSYRSFCMQLARIHAANGDTAQASRFAHKAMRRPLPAMSRLTAARAAYILGEMHLAAERPDSALKYCGIAAQLELLDADKLFKRIRAAGGLEGSEHDNLESMRAKYGREFLRAAELLNMQLHTAEGSLIDLSDTDGKAVYLLFSAESCGICAEEFPNVARAIHETDPAAEILILTREATPKVKAHYGAFTRHVPLDRNIEYQSSVQAMPTVKVVIDGLVDQTINGLGAHSTEQFIRIAERNLDAAN